MFKNFYSLIKRFLPFILLIVTSAGCDNKTSKPVFIASSPPLAAIMQEIAGDAGEVESLVPPGASPHTFSPKPSDIRKMESATAVFYVSPLLDSWAVNYPGSRKIEIIDLVPGQFLIPFEGGNVIDPHFWMDPLAVKALLPHLAGTMSKVSPMNDGKFRKNAEIFAGKLDSLNEILTNLLKPVRGKTVFLFHPSIRYMLNRYGLTYGGAIESSPGKEPTPRYIADFIDRIKHSGVKTIFTEPQFTEIPARSIAESAGVNVAELDPLGGGKGRKTYFEIMVFNANVLAKGL